FFWTLGHIIPETLLLTVVLLALFFALDSFFYRHEGAARPDPTPDTESFGFDGAINFALLAVVVGLVLMSGVWQPGVVFDVMGTEVGLPGLVRDLGLIAVTV